MKKILLIVAVVLCVAIAGTALAVSYNNPASNPTGTMTVDSYIKLDLDGNTSASLALKAGDYAKYTIVYDVVKSASVDDTATLTIALANTDETHNLTGVQVALFTDENCTTPLKLTGTAVDQENGTAVTQSGAGTITITGLTEGDTYYARFFLPEDATVENISGTMTLNLVRVAA